MYKLGGRWVAEPELDLGRGRVTAGLLGVCAAWCDIGCSGKLRVVAAGVDEPTATGSTFR